MKSTAPLAYAVAVSASSPPKAVTKMIGVSSDWGRCRISLAVSNPSRVGIRTSIRIIANGPTQNRAQRLASGVDLDHVVTQRREHRADRDPLGGVVVDDQNRR